jgi:hypothetical protein
MGYTVGEKNTAEYAEITAHRQYAPPTGAPTVEIHWSIQGGGSPFRVDLDSLWTRARPVLIAGVDVLALPPEDMLVHLCVHASQHHVFGFGLRPFCDIAETMRHYQSAIDWEQLVFLTRQWGASRCVHLTLYLAKDWLSAAVPDAVLAQLGSGPPDPGVVAWINARVFTPQAEGGDPLPANQGAGPVSNPWGRIHTSTNTLEKLCILLEACFPPPKVLAGKYALSSGSWRAYLYYPIHLRDLAMRHTRRAWQLLHHDAEAELWIARQVARIERETRWAEYLAWQEWLGAPDGPESGPIDGA